MSINNFFENRNGKIYCLKDCEFIIDKHNVNELPNGDLDVLLFGNLVCIHNPEKNSRDFYTITLATRVEMSIYSISQITKDEDDHYIISYNEGDEVIHHETVPVSVDNVNEIFNNLLGGRVSNLIPYHEYYNIVLNCVEINEPLGFPRILLELLISESFSADDGKSLARLQNNQMGKARRIRNSVLSKNTFNAMTFEDWGMAQFENKVKPFEEQEKEPSLLEKYMRK